MMLSAHGLTGQVGSPVLAYKFLTLVLVAQPAFGIIYQTKKCLYAFGANGFGDPHSDGDPAEDYRGPKVIQLLPSTEKVKIHNIPEWTLQNECYVYKYEGDRSQRPIIYFGGNTTTGWSAVQFWLEDYAGLFPTLPTVYAMNYIGRSQARESVLMSNGTRLVDLVYGEHGMVPHIFGSSLGCAISIGTIHKLAGKYEFPSLTLCDPFTSVADMCGRFSLEYILSGVFGEDSWASIDRVQHEIFKKIPVLVWSATEDIIIPAEMHNEIYRGLVSFDWTVPIPITENNMEIHETANSLGVPRMLVEVKTTHVGPPILVLRHGEHKTENCWCWLADHYAEHLPLKVQDCNRVKSFISRYIINGQKYAGKDQPVWIPWIAPQTTATGWSRQTKITLLVVFGLGFSMAALLLLYFFLKRRKENSLPRADTEESHLPFRERMRRRRKSRKHRKVRV